MSPLVRSIFVLVMLWLAVPGALASRYIPLFVFPDGASQAEQVTPVVADHFGNVVAQVSGGQVLWSSNHVDGYGPLLGGAMPRISDSVSLAEASVWRGKRMDPTGFYYLGARHYEPTSGRFLSPDPAGHEGSYDLYSFANGDPVNSFDPDGRYGKPTDYSFGSFGYDNSSASVGSAWFRDMTALLDELRYANSSSGQFMQAYHQTQADMRRTCEFHEVSEPTWGSFASSALNLTPGLGAAKMWWEGGFSGRDMITGEWIDRSGWETFAGVSLNAVGTLGMTGGMMSQAAQGARFSSGYLNWEARSISWQMSYHRSLPLAAEGTTAVEQGGLNLFKWKDATSTTATGWKEGDYFLNLPNQGSAQANWIQNSSRLRAEMGKGNPIFDSFRDAATGEQISTRGFLNAERNLLENRGWNYNPQTGAYHPPGTP